MAQFSDVYEIMARAKLKDLDSAVGTIKELGDVAEDTGDQTEDLGEKSSKSAGLLGNLTKAAKLAAIGIGALAVVGIGAVTGAVGTAIHDLQAMDGALKLVEARTGASAAEMEVFRDSIEDVWAGGFGEGVDQIASDLALITQVTGAQGDALTEIAKDAYTVTEVFDRDMTETIRAADTAMENFGISSDHTFDLITRGFQVTGDPAGDLLDTLNEYSANFADMGFTADEMLSMLASGLDAGARNTDDLADGMREFQIRLKDGTSDLSLWTLGLDGMNAQYKRGEIDGREMFIAVRDALSSIEDPLKRNALGVEIFGTKWEDAGESVFLAMDSAYEGLDNVSGATDRAADAMARGLGPAWQRFTRTLRVAVANAIKPAYDWINGKLIDALDGATEGLENWLLPAVENMAWGFQHFVMVLRNLWDSFSEGRAVLSEQAEMLGFFMGNTDRANKAAAGFLETFYKLKDGAVDLVNNGLTVLSNALSNLGIDTDAIKTDVADALSNLNISADDISLEGLADVFSTDLLTTILAIMGMIIGGPIGFGVGIVKLLITAIETDFLGFGTALENSPVVQSITDGLGGLWDLVTGFFGGGEGGAGDIDTSAVTSVTSSISNALTPLLDFAEEQGAKIAAGLTSIKDGIIGFFEAFKGTETSNIVQLAQDIGDVALAALSRGISAFVSVLGPLADAGGTLVGGMFEVLGEQLPKLGEGISSLITAIDRLIGGDYEGALRALAGGIDAFFGAFSGTVVGYVETWIDAIKDLTGLDLNIDFSKIIEGATGIGSALIDGIGDGLDIASKVLVWSLEIVGGIYDHIVNTWAGMLAGSGLKILSGLGSGLIGIRSWVDTNIVTPIAETISAAIDKAGAVMAVLADFGPNMFQAILDSIGDIGEWINDNILQPIVDEMKKLGTMIAQAINDAIPNDVGFSVDIPLVGRQTFEVDLPDNPIPVGQDSGGYMRANRPVLIGVGAQPELFVPDSPGRFYPAGKYAVEGSDGREYIFNGDMNFYGVQNIRDLVKQIEDFTRKKS